jgi:hypothetical protein
MPDINDLRRLRKAQIHSYNVHLWNDRGAPDFSDFDPDKVLAGDLWRCTVEEVTVNSIEGNVKLYEGDIVIALEDDPGALTYENINAGKWQIIRRRPVGEGAKQTGVDGGYQWEESFADDFKYICTVAGEPETSEGAANGTATWKRFQLHST